MFPQTDNLANHVLEQLQSDPKSQIEIKREIKRCVKYYNQAKRLHKHFVEDYKIVECPKDIVDRINNKIALRERGAGAFNVKRMQDALDQIVYASLGLYIWAEKTGDKRLMVKTKQWILDRLREVDRNLADLSGLPHLTCQF